MSEQTARMSILTVTDVSREYLDEAAKAALASFREAVKPIYGVTDKGDPVHIGSALLLDLAEGRFMLTAAHVIDWNQKTSLYLGGDDFASLQFEALITVAPNGNRDEDHSDFAIARLDTETLEKLSSARFVTEAEISTSGVSSEGRTYTCLGYPNSKNKVKPLKGSKVTPALLPYTSVGKPASQLSKIAKDDVHVLVDYNNKYAKDESGGKVSAIAMRGCSGGAIIDVGRFSLETLQSYKFEPKLAALFIEGHAEEKVVLGIRLTSILTAIREHLQNAPDGTAAAQPQAGPEKNCNL